MSGKTTKLGFPPAGPTRQKRKQMTSNTKPHKKKARWRSDTFRRGKAEVPAQTLSPEFIARRDVLFAKLTADAQVGETVVLEPATASMPAVMGYRGF